MAYGKMNAHEKLVNLVNHGASVLDVGCSSGYLGKKLIDEKGCSVWGIEIDKTKAEEAKKFYKDVYTGSVDDEDFLNSIRGKFDIIIFADVVEHLKKPEGMLRFTTRWLGEDGYMLLSVPNIGHWSVIKDLILGRFKYEESGLLDRTHIHFYTKKSLENLLRSCKLEAVLKDRTLGIFVEGIKNLSAWHKFKIKLIKLLFIVFPDLFTYQFIYKAKPGTNA